MTVEFVYNFKCVLKSNPEGDVPPKNESQYIKTHIILKDNNEEEKKVIWCEVITLPSIIIYCFPFKLLSTCFISLQMI